MTHPLPPEAHALVILGEVRGKLQEMSRAQDELRMQIDRMTGSIDTRMGPSMSRARDLADNATALGGIADMHDMLVARGVGTVSEDGGVPTARRRIGTQMCWRHGWGLFGERMGDSPGSGSRDNRDRRNHLVGFAVTAFGNALSSKM